MKRRIKQITAFICASIMAISGCLIDGVIVSRADGTSAEGSGPVIKFNNPGIGVDVGEEINLSQYAVQFKDGEDAVSANWYVKKKVVPYGAPAIGVDKITEPTTLDLSEYAVEFEEGTVKLVDTWMHNGTELQDKKLEMTENGVYQLKALTNAGDEQFVYVVTKSDDGEYVLYYNGFGEDDVRVDEVTKSGTTYEYLSSKNDFVNVSDEDDSANPNYLTKIRTKYDKTKYTLVTHTDGTKWIELNRTDSIQGANIHLLLPDWLGKFGDYDIKMSAKVLDSYDSNDKVRPMLGVDLRAQYAKNIPSAAADYLSSNTTAYFGPNYLVQMRTNKMASFSYTKDGYLQNGGESNLELVNLGTFSSLSLENAFEMNVKMRQDDGVSKVAVQFSQDGNYPEEIEYFEINDTKNKLERTGRIGIYAFRTKVEIDYIKVSLLENIGEPQNVPIETFVPSEKGVYELIAKTTDSEKPIYVIAKNPEDTEYVLWENNFDTAADAPIALGSLDDYEGAGFARVYGKAKFEVNEETGRLDIEGYNPENNNAATKGHFRFPKWIGNFGNYRIQMTEQTTDIAGSSLQVGLFARGGDSRNYTPNYSVRTRYRGYASDGISLAMREEWLDSATKTNLNYTDIVWGKVLNREKNANKQPYIDYEREYVHELFVQDELIEYKINNITRLYDVREREFSTGYAGILIDDQIKVSIDNVRVLFVPNTTVPAGPTSATYNRTTTTPGMADGKVTVELQKDNTARDVLCYWGNAGEELEGYTHFGKAVVEEGETSVTVELGKNIMVPQGATELLVYAENHMGRSSEYVTIPLKERVTPLQTGEEIVSFQVISDTHITTKTDGYASLNFEKFLTDLTTNDPDSIGIFIGGDLVDNGKQAEYDTFKSIWTGVETKTGKTLPSMHAVIGNHEFWTESTYDGTVTLFNKNTGRTDEKTLYYAEEVSGYHFIYLASGKLTASYNSHTNAELGEEQLKWFNEQMQTRAEDGKPIFVFLHQPLQNTVTGAGSDSVKDHEEVKAILKDYPQAFFFTSHSHMNLDTPGTMVSAEEGLCNMFNTSAISYLMNTHYTDKTITSDGAQAYYVEVYADKVLVRGKDVTTNTWLPSAQFVVSFAEESQSSFEIEIGGSDVSYLDGSFDAYQYKKPTTKENTYAVTGPVKPSDYYTTEYVGQSAKGALKPTSIPGGNGKGGYSALTYKKSEMKNFVAEYEFYGGHSAITGIAFGGKEGVFPVSLDGKVNETGVLLYMTNNGYVYVGGAIDTNFDHIKKPSDVNLSTTVAGQEAFLEGTTFIRATRLVVNESDKTLGLDVVEGNVTSESPTRTICVKVQNGTLTIYDKEHADKVLEIPLTSAYDGGYVSLISNTAMHGGFKNFSIQELKNWDYDMKVKLSGASVSYLDDAFDVYQYKSPTRKENAVAILGPVNPSDTYEEDGKTYTYFTTSSHGQYANGGLKPTSIGGGESVGYTALTYTKDTVKDFELEYDFYPGHGVNGLIIGGKINTLPMTLNSSDTAGEDIGIGIRVENTGHLSVWGVIDATTENIVTSNSSIEVNVKPSTDYSYMNNAVAKVRISGMTGEELNKSVTLLKEDTDYYTICVKMKDGVLTIYEKDHPSRVVSIPVVTTRYKGGYVSLISNTEQSGAFGGFRISKISEGYDFRYYSTGELDPYFDSYYFAADAEGVKGATIAEQWNQTTENQDTGMTTAAIKPIHKDENNQSSLLTLKESNVKNFHAVVEYYTSTVSNGFVVAPEGQLATSKSGVMVYVKEDTADKTMKLCVEGAIDSSTGTWSGSEDSTNSANQVTSPALEGYVKPSTKDSAYKTRYFLNVRVQDGVLVAWVEGLQGELSVKLTGGYEGGKISLYSKGRDTGGLWQFYLETLDAIPETRISFPFDLSTDGEFVKVEVSTDAVYSKLVGNLKYDTSKFELVLAEMADTTLNANVLIEAVNGTIPLSMLINTNGGSDKVLTLYFKELVDTLDFTGFNVDEYDVMSSGGVSATRVDSRVTVEYDYNENKVIDVLDLVRGKKNSTEETTVEVFPIRRLLVGKTTYGADAGEAIIINKDVTVKAGDTLGTEGATTIYRDCTIDFSNFTAATDVDLVGSVVLDNVTVEGADKANVFANGYELKVNDNTTFDTALRRLYGGKSGEQTFTTNLTLLAGQYTYIYTGASSAKVIGDTHVTLGGNAIAKRVNGGGIYGDVSGNTYVTIRDNAQITDVYGGGYMSNSENPAQYANVQGNSYVNITGGRVDNLYGGGWQNTTVSGATIQGNVYVNFMGGNVKNLYGGGRGATVNGDTYVVVGGTANADCDVADHEANTKYFVFGGGYTAYENDPKARVKGNTYVTVQDSAQAHLVYGGGCGANTEVQGVCNVDIQGGYVMGYYGGSRDKGIVHKTNVTMTAGKTEQIFGGCDRYSMTGDVNVTVTGGEVQRRIYGGCYNDYDNDNDKWLTSYGVNGQVSVIIGGNANLSFDLKVLAGGIFSVKADNSLMAASRYSGEIENEIGILIFLDDSYADNSGKIGYHADSLVGLEDKFTDRHYDYLVKSNKGGTIFVKENALNIVPNDGNSVTVSDGENVVYSASESGNYILPALNNNSQKTLNVNF